MMKNKLLMALLLSLAGTSYASQGDINGVISTVSYHWQNNEKYNNLNYGAKVEYEFIDNWTVYAGAFRNSIKKTESWSEQVGLTYKFLQVEKWNFGVTYNVNNGYSTCNRYGTNCSSDYKQKAAVNVCRQIGESTRTQACVSTTFWEDHNYVPTSVLTFKFPLNNF